MKKIILYSLSLLAFCENVKAQYLAASIPETTLPAPLAATLNARNTNCHSLNATQGSNNYELYTYTWDSYDQNTGGNGIAFGWRAAGSTAPMTMSYATSLGLGSMKASDIAIVQTPSGNVYLVVSYYDGTTVNGPLKVEVLRWNIMPGTLTPGAPVTIDNVTNVTGTTPDVPTLHIDAIDCNHIGLSWTNLNSLKIEIGQVTDAMTFIPYGTPHVVYGIKFDENRNDIALSDVNGNYKVTYVGVHGTSTSVYSNDFSFIQGLPANAQLVPDVTGWPSLSYTNPGIPRIDCPDYSNDYKWSMITGHDQLYISAMRLDGIVSTIDLTGGMGVLVPQLLNYAADTWLNTAVAYDADNSNVHFAWMTFINGSGFRYNGIKLDPTNVPSGTDWDLIETNPQTGSTSITPTVSLFNGSKVSTVKVSPNVTKRVYFGTVAGRIIKVDSAHTTSPIAVNITGAGMSGSASCIEVEAGNENHILVTYSNFGVNSIWESINGGSSWTSIEGNLPDMPVRWIIFNPNNSTQAMIATELGVWTTDLLNGITTDW